MAANFAPIGWAGAGRLRADGRVARAMLGETPRGDKVVDDG
jgi:hypothetical protein